MIHPINQHLIPRDRHDDYPVLSMPMSAVDIAMIAYDRVRRDECTISEARAELFAYPHFDRCALLASFDRKLMQTLEDCADRPCSFRA